MYLSNFNSIPDAIEWLSENTNESWSWKNVIEFFLKMNPETITVNIPIGTPLLRLSPGEIQEVPFSNPVLLEVCNVKDFLEHILMGDNFKDARASPLALICGSSRFRSSLPIPASAIRLKKIEIHQLEKRFTLYPFRKLVKNLQEGRHPDLAALVRYDNDDATTAVSPAIPIKVTPETCPTPAETAEYLGNPKLLDREVLLANAAEKNVVPSQESSDIERLKRSALVAKCQHQWNTVVTDLAEISRNGLDVAKLERGFYDLSKAIQWATERGKFKEATLITSPSSSILKSPVSVIKRNF